MKFVTNQLYRNIFISWFIAIPFGTASLSLSFGTLTLYPALLFMLAVFVISIAKIKFHWGKMELLIIALFTFLTAYSIYNFPDSNFKQAGYIAIKSWIFLWITVVNFIMGLKIMGSERFNDVLRIGVRIFIGILLLFGIFEVLTGIHFADNFTQHYGNSIENVKLAPFFIYKNPNIYIVVLFLLSVLLMWLDEKFRKSRGGVFALFILIYFFSFLIDSSIGKTLSLLTCLALIIINFYEWRKFIFGYRYGIIFAASLMILLLAGSQLYFNPEWKKNTNKPIETYSISNSINQHLSNLQVRKNHALNGIYLFKSSNFLGAGSGQYFVQSKASALPYPTENQAKPHNYFTELIAQWGIVGLIIPIFMLFACVKMLINKQKSFFFRFWFIFGIALFWLISLIPATFIDLNINWIFTATIVILFLQINQQFKELERTK